MGWRAVAVALVAGTLLIGGGSRVARAEPVLVSLVSCPLLAPYVDGNAADEVTSADLDLACQQKFPAAAVAGV